MSHDNHMRPVTIAARAPEREPLETLAFELSEAEREKAAKAQAELALHRNAPQKRGWPA